MSASALRNEIADEAIRRGLVEHMRRRPALCLLIIDMADARAMSDRQVAGALRGLVGGPGDALWHRTQDGLAGALMVSLARGHATTAGTARDAWRPIAERSLADITGAAI